MKIKLPSNIEIDKNRLLTDSLNDAFVSVSYNSTALIDSIINGCPIFCFNKLSPVYDLASHNIEEIENPFLPSENQIKQALCNISYMQWNEKEIKLGLPFDYLNNLIISN